RWVPRRADPLFPTQRTALHVASTRPVPPSSPTVRAVYEYERVIQENAARAQSLQQWASLGLEASEDVASRAVVQMRASRAACGNLQTHNANLAAVLQRFNATSDDKVA